MSNNSAADLGSALGLQSTVTVVKSHRPTDPVSKREGELLRSNALNVEDSQTAAFEGIGKGKLLRPTYDPFLLALLMQQNNTLMQCSAAMEVNIDGTGYQIEKDDGDSEKGATEDAKIKLIKQFFDEPYPGESFISQRRALRRDLEGTGNGYIEVIRNAGGDIVFLRRLDAKLMRLVRLDEPVAVNKTVMRMGKETTVKMLERERRFCMQVGSKLRFFREFGSSREVNIETGAWLGQAPSSAKKLGPDLVAPPAAKKPSAVGKTEVDYDPPETKQLFKGSEVIHLTAIPDVGTGYGVPRWISQVPSVLGSRKAEEFNLEFFNSGGLPPAMVLVQGGQLSTEARNALTNYLSGKAKFKQRAIIAEVFPASGDIGSAGSVKVTVERFGDERQKDSMFQNYDKACSDHVRGAFRLPPLFLGNSVDHNFATAYASYMVAEAQVFRPEREEFDEIINVKIMQSIAPGYTFRSLPLSITDVATQLKALELGKDLADPEEFLKTLNELANVTLTPRDGLDEDQALGLVNQMLGRDSLGNKLDGKDQKQLDKNGKEIEDDTVVKITAGKKGKIAKFDDGILAELADDWANHLSGRLSFEPASVDVMSKLIKSLQPTVRKLFNSYVAVKMVDAKHDVAGTGALLAHAGECLSHTD